MRSSIIPLNCPPEGIGNIIIAMLRTAPAAAAMIGTKIELLRKRTAATAWMMPANSADGAQKKYA
jgi:hypothetical protein